MNKLIFICLLTLFFSNDAFSKNFSILKFDITGNKQASSAIKVINEALKAKKFYSWHNTFEPKAIIRINEVKIKSVDVRDGKILAFNALEDVYIDELFVPAPWGYSILDSSNIAIFPDPESEKPVYSGLKLRGRPLTILSIDGKFKFGFSGAFQTFRNKAFYENDIIVADVKEGVKPIRMIKHFGKTYSLENYQENGAIPIDGIAAAPIGSHFSISFRFSKKGEHFGNICENCIYRLCLKDDHFYVYMIEFANFEKDKIQGKPLKNKFDQELYFESGDSTIPYIRKLEDEPPFQNNCSFEPFKA